jgi:outer membrane lipoprotein-sorting protein
LRIALIKTAQAFSGSVLAALLLVTPGCAVRKVTHVHAPGQAVPAREASLAELVAKISAWSSGFQTLTATVDLAPTAGSVYSGVIKEYRDVKGFVLLQRPSAIRMLGQAPVVRTTVFDMASNGEEFRLYIPSKQKFIIGKTTVQRPVKNALENLRPQHILQALIVPPIDADRETTYREKLSRRSEPTKRYFVVSIIESQPDRHVILRRKAWFDRADLELVRSQFYEPDGTCTEDVQYSNYQDFQGIHYPTHIELNRPEDDYAVIITIEKATFNDPIPREKFDLQEPEGAELVNLGAPKQEEHPVDQ